MITRLVIFILAFGFAMPVFAAIPAQRVAPKLIVTVSLSQQSMTIRKNTPKSRSVITAWIIPIKPGTLRPGTYTLTRMTDEYKTRNGNVVLKNVVRTSGNFNIRTTEMFEHWKTKLGPASHTIVLSAQDGSMLFTTVRNIGIDKTLLRVIP